VQKVGETLCSSVTTCTMNGSGWGANITAGNAIVAFVLTDSASIAPNTPTDAESNTYSQTGTTSGAGLDIGGASLMIAVACNAAGGSKPGITVTTGSSTNIRIQAVEVAGVNNASSSSCIDQCAVAASCGQYNSNTGTGGTIFTSPTLTTTQANEALFGYAATASGTISPGNGGAVVANWVQGCSTGTLRCWEVQFVHAKASYAAQFKSSASSDKGGAIFTALISSTQPANGFPMVVENEDYWAPLAEYGAELGCFDSNAEGSAAGTIPCRGVQ
jgi:hypothetical protein